MLFCGFGRMYLSYVSFAAFSPYHLARRVFDYPNPSARQVCEPVCSDFRVEQVLFLDGRNSLGMMQLNQLEHDSDRQVISDEQRVALFNLKGWYGGY